MSGYSCVKTNEYYSQCLPGSAASTTAPATTTVPNPSTTITTPPGGTTVAAVGNPFSGVALYANPYYASEINSIAIPSLTAPMATKAAAVAKVPTFVWL